MGWLWGRNKEQKKLEKIYKDSLEEGYEICPECDGLGYTGRILCHKCWGEGKLDWVERVMGKECPFEVSGQSISSSSSSSSSNSSSSSSSSTPFELQLRKYIENLKGNKHDENRIRGRTIQRFHKMFNKFKGCLQ